MHPFTKLLTQYPVRRYAPGEMILYQGEVPNAAYVVKSGLVKAYNISAQGDEKPIQFSGPTEILSFAWVFGKSNSSMYFHEAHTDSTVYILPRQDLMDLVRRHNDVLLFLLERFVSLSAARSLQINALEHSKAADKILHMLYCLCQTHGREQADGTIMINVPLTQQTLANLLGLTRETTGIELLKLKQNGLVTFSRKKYYVNKEKLIHMMGESEFENLNL